VLLSTLSLLTAAPAPPPPEEGVPPDPPRQGQRWTPPKHRLPNAWVVAADTLFEQGLADPRGCEYRVVRVTAGKGWLFNQTTGTAPLTTHAWVLPTRPGEERRFAIGWNSLVAPVDSVGERADLAADVREQIRAIKHEDRGDVVEDRPYDTDGSPPWYRLPDDLAPCLLLRPGEGELASRLWEAQHAGNNESDDPYPRLAALWLSDHLTVAFAAHRRGEDARALHALRKLVARTEQVEAEARQRGKAPEKGIASWVQDYSLVPAVLADQERRAREKKREPVVCAGPGRIADQRKRIAALIERLDEVTEECGASEFNLFPNGLAPGRDPIVRALVREGGPAIEPLLDCLARDKRLTRHIGYPSNMFSSRLPPLNAQSVGESAFQALDKILYRQGISLSVANEEEGGRKNPSPDAIRTRIKQSPGASPAERRFRVLMDDSAGQHRWLDAARALFERDDSGADAKTWDAPHGQVQPLTEPAARRLVDDLRDRKDPTVTEVLCKRIGQFQEEYALSSIAGWLADWDPARARAVLPGISERMRKTASPPVYRWVLSARLKAGDKRVLDDYAQWLRTAPLSVLKDDPFGDTLGLMAENPDHPGMTAAARALFGEKGTWRPFWPLTGARSGPGYTHLSSLVETRLLRIEPFRSAVLTGFRDKSRAGSASVSREGHLYIDWGNNCSSSWPIRVDAGVPLEELKSDFRVCDLFACLVAEHVDAAPRCELYWPEARRQAAVEACARFLTAYGGRLGAEKGGIAFPRQDRPASPEQVRQNLAIFSLAGEGESRVVRLPAFPLAAGWTALKDFPYKVYDVPRPGYVLAPRTAFLQEGRVWQAEEVLKDGKWRRYYGFTGSHRIARVAAEEIEFPAEEGRWIPLADGLDGRLLVPPLPLDPDWDGPPRFAADTPLRLTLSLRNRTGLDRRVAAMPPGTRPQLWHSPETVSRKGELVPAARSDEDWAEVPLKSALKLSGLAERTLGPAEEFAAGTVDLGDNFDLRKPGFYRLRLTRDGNDADKEREASAEIRFSLAPR
jgi:hypothetical protein